MRNGIVIICIVLLIGAGSTIAAQADCFFRVLIDVRNEANNPITNAKFRLSGRDFYYRPVLRKYETTGLLLPRESFTDNLKVSARGYKSLQHEIKVACSEYEYLIIMRPKKSKLEPEFKVTSKAN